jgi:serine/threonine-protein kinase RsbW
MEISLSLNLPREALTVPVARHVVRHAMEAVGVAAACVSDVELALSEACTNVLLHAGSGDYDVRLDLADRTCSIRVVDVGRGLDPAAGDPAPDAEAERGRGLVLLRALVDSVRFDTRPDAGTVVRLEKRLSYANPALLGGAPPAG